MRISERLFPRLLFLSELLTNYGVITTMKKSVLSVAVAAAMTVSATASAGQAEDMERALRSLEAQVSAMKAEMAKMKEEQAEVSAGAEWANNVSFGGVIEYEIPEGGNGTLAKVELDITAQLSDNVTGFVKLKDTSGGSTAPLIDEAAITMDTSYAAFTITTGGHPFGDFSTNMISDPLTKTYGDTDHSTAASARIIAEIPVTDNVGMALSADDDISSANISYSDDSLTVRAGHITKVVDETGKSANTLFASYNIGDVTMSAESVDNDGGTDATNVELAYGFAVAGHDAGVAIGRQEQKVNSPEKLNMYSGTVNVAEGLDLTLEYKDSDNNTNDAWLAQVAYGF